MNQAAQYAESHFPEFLEKLKTLVRIPSVSFAGFSEAEVRRSAVAVSELLRTEGLENVEVLTIEGAHPYVYGDWLHAPGKPTLLLYAHHDVQPPGREELWNSAPFEPTEKDGRLFGRGSADDKAGIIVHTSAIASYLRTEGKLPVNIKVLIEGEEEIGSGHLDTFLKQYRSKMSADVIVLTDTANFDTGIPTITTSLRGIAVTEVEVRSLKQPVHSGMWGGPAPDPVMALSKMISSLVDDDGRIAIPGIYDKIRRLSKKETESMLSLGYTEADYRKQAGILPSVQLIAGDASPLEKLFRLPSLSVNAIQASSRKNASNIINESAWARISIRIVPDMDPHQTLKSLQTFLKSVAPWGVEVHFSGEQTGDWWVTDPSGPAFEKAEEALSRAFGKKCVFLGQGGSIPFVAPFAQVLGGVPALLIGVEDPYTNAHSENESVHLEDLRKSIVGAVYLYEAFAK